MRYRVWENRLRMNLKEGKYIKKDEVSYYELFQGVIPGYLKIMTG